MSELTPGRAQRFLDALHVDPKTVRSVLRMMLAHAVLEGAIPDNPVAKLPRAVSAHEQAAEPKKALAATELVAVREAILRWENSAHRWLPLMLAFLLQLVTGTRIGEVLAIRWCDIDMERGVVEVNGQVVYEPGVGLIRVKTKSPMGMRTLHAVPAPVVDLLKELLVKLPQDIERSIAPVLLSREGTYIWPNNLHRAWRDARKRSDAVDLSTVTPHNLRKTTGTTVAEAVGVLAASKFMGHTVAVFEKHYNDRRAHLDDVREVIAGLANGWVEGDDDDPFAVVERS